MQFCWQSRTKPSSAHSSWSMFQHRPRRPLGCHGLKVIRKDEVVHMKMVHMKLKWFIFESKAFWGLSFQKWIRKTCLSMFSTYAYCIKDSSQEGAKIGPIQSPCEVPLKCLRFLKAKPYSTLMIMWSFSNWLIWLPLFRFFFVRIDRSSHIRNFKPFVLVMFSLADGLTAPSSDEVRPKPEQNHNQIWIIGISTNRDWHWNHTEIEPVINVVKKPSLPPSWIRTASPAGRDPVSLSMRRLIAAISNLLCLPSRRGGRRREGWVPASPHTFVSWSQGWIMMIVWE